MDNNEVFLNMYRTLESLLREKGVDYKDFENAADCETQERLRICRQMRNYLVHRSDGLFLSVSDLQVDFLVGVIAEVKLGLNTLTDEAVSIRAGCCKTTDTYLTARKKMIKNKTEVLCIYNDDRTIAGFLSLWDVLRADDDLAIGGSRKLKRKPWPGSGIVIASGDVLENSVSLSGCKMICCTEAAGGKTLLSGVVFCGKDS